MHPKNNWFKNKKSYSFPHFSFTHFSSSVSMNVLCTLLFISYHLIFFTNLEYHPNTWFRTLPRHPTPKSGLNFWTKTRSWFLVEDSIQHLSQNLTQELTSNSRFNLKIRSWNRLKTGPQHSTSTLDTWHWFKN